MTLVALTCFLLLLLPLGAFRIAKTNFPACSSNSKALLMASDDEREILRDELIRLCDKSPDKSNRPQIVELIEELSKRYPCTSKPLHNWKYRVENDQSNDNTYKPPSQYDGIWDTRYTSADANLSTSTRQLVNSTSSEVKYVVEGWKGKALKINGYDIVYKLQAISDYQYKLCTKKITLYRKSRIGLTAISLPFLVNFILKRLNHKSESTLEIVYMDDEMCIERSEKEYYIKTRLYETWNPLNPKGWELVSCL